MSYLSQDFLEFLNEDINRSDFIQEWLLKNGVTSNRISMEGKHHILVQFPKEKYNPAFKIKTVIAHHDRVKNTPGANDNSATCWNLMNWAVHLSQSQDFHNVRIFFTDGEELGWNAGIKEQGAFGIASTFKRLGITKDDIYVFDACGRGNICVLSKNNIPENAPLEFKKQFNDFHNRTQSLLQSANPNLWMTLPVPYSDNASFLAAGIPAVAITMLPADEATLYVRELMNNKSLENSVTNRAVSKQDRLEGKIRDYGYKDRLPATWKLFHTPKDNAESLTSDSFETMQKILTALERNKVPLI